MKKLLTLILCSAIALSFTACGEKSGNNSGEINISQNATGEFSSEEKALVQKYSMLKSDELKWEYNSTAKTIIISGEGPMKDYFDEPAEWDKYSGEAEKVVIGDEVTSVSDCAFLDFKNVKEVKFGNAVEYIGNYAFYNCNNLWTINLPVNLKFVGNYAFSDTLLHSDDGFKFPNGIICLGTNSFHTAFKNSYIAIPETLTNIMEDAFSNCYVDEIRVDEKNKAYTSIDGVLYTKDVKELIHYPAGKTNTLLEIPNTVTKICRNAIEVTNTLNKIVIPASVSNIEEEAIFWNYGLSYIDVDENNKDYKSVDGVLYSKDGKELICYPAASDRVEYTVLQGTEIIYKYAMSQANNLHEIHVSEGVSEIRNFAFYNSIAFSKIGLPKSLKIVGDRAFAFCNALVEINYASSSENWRKIQFDESNEILDEDIRVYCEE